MTTAPEPEIVLYDLACIKDVCFSPAVWRTRLMLNYKQIPYKTVFLEFPDIEPTLKGLGIVPNTTAGSATKYTVPAIHHIPTNTYLMDSLPIAQFLESTYPSRPVILKSEVGAKIASNARSVVGKVFRMSIMPREMGILSPRSQEFFRRSREAEFGRSLEEMTLDADTEDKAWAASDKDIRAVDEFIRTNKVNGRFLLGGDPSWTDFFIAGSNQCARMVDEKTFERLMKYDSFKDIYEACLPLMEKRD